MAAMAEGLDLIAHAIPVTHDATPDPPWRDIDGTLVLAGRIGPLEEIMTPAAIIGRRRAAGSAVGGIAEPRERLDFRGRFGTLPEVEMIRMGRISEAFARMEKGDLRRRFVIDMGALQG